MEEGMRGGGERGEGLLRRGGLEEVIRRWMRRGRGGRDEEGRRRRMKVEGGVWGEGRRKMKRV